jgi:flagellar basal-body rod protein FlgC
MNDVSSIAQSGLQAFTAKLDVTANNIANSNTDNFSPSRVNMVERQNGGVDAMVVKTGDQVDISREAVEMLSTINGFKANLQVMKVDKEMNKSLLDIIS